MFLPSGSVTFDVTSLTPATRTASTCSGVRLSLMRYLPVLTFVVSPSHIAYSRNHVGRSITPLSASIVAIAGSSCRVLISISTSLPRARRVRLRIRERAMDEVAGDADHDQHRADHDRERDSERALGHRRLTLTLSRSACASSQPWRISAAAC